MRHALPLLLLALSACWPTGDDPEPPPELAFELAWTPEESEPVLLGAVTAEETASVTTHVRNVGSGNMAVAGILGPTAGFSLAEDLPLWLEPGEEAELTVQYRPTRSEVVAGFMTLRTQPSVGDPPRLAVRAQGLAAVLAWSFVSVLPESAEPGCLQEASLVVANEGNLPATITDLAFEDDGDFFVSSSPDLPFTLDPGAAAQVGVAFTREAPGTAIDRVVVQTDPGYAAAEGPYMQAVAGFDRAVTDTFSVSDVLYLSEPPWPPGLSVRVDGQPFVDWTFEDGPPRLLIDASTLAPGALLTADYPVVEGC